MTISSIARWKYVTGRVSETDHVAPCPLCQGHNRVRLGQGMAELERVVCPHFDTFENRIRSEGVLYFRFDSEQQAA